jgi:hypothetical protein
MYTFIISALLGVIVSKCLYGKQFNEKLATVAITVLCFTFGGTLIVSSVSIAYLPTKQVYTEKSKLLPISNELVNKDTVIRMITITKKGVKIGTKADTVITHDTIPDYFIIDLKDGMITCHTNYSTDFEEEKFYIEDIILVKVDTSGWYGVRKTKYITEGNNWITNMSIPNKNVDEFLYLNPVQYAELDRHIKLFNNKRDKNSQQIPKTDGK